MNKHLESYECVFCGSHNTTRSEEPETFTYGCSPRPEIEVTANVIVSGCINCGNQWTDGDQEQSRSNAACEALYSQIESLEAENADLKSRLDAYAQASRNTADLHQAAHNKTITPLREENARLRKVLTSTAANLAAAISLLEHGGKQAAPSNNMFNQMILDYKNSLQRARDVLKEKQDD